MLELILWLVIVAVNSVLLFLAFRIGRWYEIRKLRPVTRLLAECYILAVDLGDNLVRPVTARKKNIRGRYCTATKVDGIRCKCRIP